MALQKDYETKGGYTANYWRITAVHLTAKNIADSFKIALYKDKTSRDAGKDIILLKSYTFPIINEDTGEVLHNSPFTLEAMDTADNNTYKIAYNWLKTQAEFTGALDV
jgi:hypothetical protein